MDTNKEKRIFLQDKVESYIKEHGLLKKYFAKQIGIAPATFSSWLSGMIVLSTEKINIIRRLISED